MVKVVYIVAVEPYNAGYNLLQLRIKFKLLPILKYMYLVIYPGFSELSENPDGVTAAQLLCRSGTQGTH